MCRRECYLSIRKNGILSFAGKWMELEDIILSVISQNKERQIITYSLSYTEAMKQKRTKIRIGIIRNS
jgi:hypothetical protein